jgi:hypothetical protein
MNGEPDVIGLLQRADWTRLSLSARVNDGSTVLLAPGRRYREQTPQGLRGCDGDRAWTLWGQETDGPGHWIGGPEPPLRTLLCPSWLLRSSRLELPAPDGDLLTRSGGTPIAAARSATSPRLPSSRWLAVRRSRSAPMVTAMVCPLHRRLLAVIILLPELKYELFMMRVCLPAD